MSYCLALSGCSEITHLAEKENKRKIPPLVSGLSF